MTGGIAGPGAARAPTCEELHKQLCGMSQFDRDLLLLNLRVHLGEEATTKGLSGIEHGRYMHKHETQFKLEYDWDNLPPPVNPAAVPTRDRLH